MKKILLIIFTTTILVGGGAFYGGMKYGESKNLLSSFSRQNFQNLSPQERQQFLQGRIQRTGTGFLSGEVIAKDEKSLTIKLPDGSTKIVFFSGSTEISKITEGSLNDIEIGKEVAVFGSQNSDGSYTAKTIQLSPYNLIPRNTK